MKYENEDGRNKSDIPRSAGPFAEGVGTWPSALWGRSIIALTGFIAGAPEGAGVRGPGGGEGGVVWLPSAAAVMGRRSMDQEGGGEG